MVFRFYVSSAALHKYFVERTMDNTPEYEGAPQSEGDGRTYQNLVGDPPGNNSKTRSSYRKPFCRGRSYDQSILSNGRF